MIRDLDAEIPYIYTKVGGDLEFINFIKGSHFVGDFFPPQFWDFFPHFCFGG